MNESTSVKEKGGLQYFCPFVNISSKICPQGLCIFWKQESHNCRWNLWLEQQLLKTELAVSQLAQKLDEKFLRKEVKAWKKNLKKKT